MLLRAIVTLGWKYIECNELRAQRNPCTVKKSTLHRPIKYLHVTNLCNRSKATKVETYIIRSGSVPESYSQ